MTAKIVKLRSSFVENYPNRSRFQLKWQVVCSVFETALAKSDEMYISRRNRGRSSIFEPLEQRIWFKYDPRAKIPTIENSNWNQKSQWSDYLESNKWFILYSTTYIWGGPLSSFRTDYAVQLTSEGALCPPSGRIIQYNLHLRGPLLSFRMD